MAWSLGSALDLTPLTQVGRVGLEYRHAEPCFLVAETHGFNRLVELLVCPCCYSETDEMGH